MAGSMTYPVTQVTYIDTPSSSVVGINLQSFAFLAQILYHFKNPIYAIEWQSHEEVS